MEAVHAVDAVLERPCAEEDREHVGLLRDVEGADLLCEPLLGLGERATRRAQLPPRGGALMLEPLQTRLNARERRLRARQLRLEREQLEARPMLRRRELGTAGAECRRVVGVGLP